MFSTYYSVLSSSLTPFYFSNLNVYFYTNITLWSTATTELLTWYVAGIGSTNVSFTSLGSSYNVFTGLLCLLLCFIVGVLLG